MYGDAFDDLLKTAETVWQKQAAADPRVEKAFLSVPLSEWKYTKNEYGDDQWRFGKLFIQVSNGVVKGFPSFFLLRKEKEPVNTSDLYTNLQLEGSPTMEQLATSLRAGRRELERGQDKSQQDAYRRQYNKTLDNEFGTIKPA